MLATDFDRLSCSDIAHTPSISTRNVNLKGVLRSVVIMIFRVGMTMIYGADEANTAEETTRAKLNSGPGSTLP